MTESAIANWHDYFITVAQVSATLAGLLFVGLTISLGHVLQGYGYLMRAFTALFLQFEMLLIGLFVIIPVSRPFVLGGELIVTGAAILGGISVFRTPFPGKRNLSGSGFQRTAHGARHPHLCRNADAGRCRNRIDRKHAGRVLFPDTG